MSDLKDNPFLKFEDAGEAQIPTATLQVYEFISEYLTREKDTHVNRASSATLCPKRRWFQRKGVEGKPITPRKIVNFLLGDLSEKTMNYFVKQGCVGPGKLYSEVDFGTPIGSFNFQNKQIEIYKQQDLVANIAGFEVTAHVDGWGKRNIDGKWELIEFKSASNYGFSDFKKEGPGDYLRQATVNLQTNRAQELEAKEVRFFYLRKETGHLWSSVHSITPELIKEVEDGFRIANGEQEPPTPHAPEAETFRGKPTGRMVLGFPCSYCPYIEKCHKAEVEFKNDQWLNQRPVYVVKE